MESGTSNHKMKIAWICHFHDEFLYNYLNIKRKTETFAPWITALIKIFENDPSFELHVIAPHKGIKKDVVFFRNNVFYYFYSVGLPVSNKFNVNDFDRITDYLLPKIKVRKLIKNINPDIIHLHGAENPYYSSTIIQFFKKYPVLITIQGFIFLTTTRNNYKLRDRINVEKFIISTFKHFGIRTNQMKEEILKYNKTAQFHWHLYPLNLPDNFENLHTKNKNYDAVFFAKICKDKGIEDLIEAAHIVIQKIPEFKLIVIGSAEPKYLSLLKARGNSLNLENNIEWKGFIDNQQEVYKYCSASKISVLPTYHDIIPGTIIESMLLKTAVVAYSVGGIPEINNNNEVISLVERGNINQLADKILYLLYNESVRLNMSEGAFLRAKEMFYKENIKHNLINIYKLIISSYSRPVYQH